MTTGTIIISERTQRSNLGQKRSNLMKLKGLLRRLWSMAAHK